MKPILFHRSIVFAGTLSLATGCGLFAPLKPLPSADAEVDIGSEAIPDVPEPGIDGGARDGAQDVLSDGPTEASNEHGEAGEAGNPADPGNDAATGVEDAGDATNSSDAYHAADGGKSVDAGDTNDAPDDAVTGDAIDAAPDVPVDGANGGDAAEAGINPDAGLPGVACDPSMPFGEPVLVYGLNRNLGTDQRIGLSPDELTAYVSVGSFMGLTQLSVANRASRADPFGPLVRLHQLDGPGHEMEVSVSGNGLMLFFDNDWTGIGRVVVATRQITSQPFGPPVMVQIQGDRDHFSPHVLPDGSALYFSSNEDGPVAFYRVDLQGTTPGPPTLVWTRGADVQHPVVSADELTLYYSAGGEAAGDFADIWVTTRASKDGPFGEPTSVIEVNTSSVEFPQWISPDGCRLYLGRSPSNTENYLYVAERGRN